MEGEVGSRYIRKPINNTTPRGGNRERERLTKKEERVPGFNAEIWIKYCMVMYGDGGFRNWRRSIPKGASLVERVR